MLINCPECGKEISDKAIQCIKCGYPINIQPQPQTRVVGRNRRQNKYHRLPNGFGQIKYLGKNRRKPYGAYLPTTEYTDKGSAVPTRALGYFETYQQAYDCLVDYNKNPYDPNITFSDIYKRMYAEKFDGKSNLSVSSQRSVQSAFNNVEPLHTKRMADIRTDDMQKIIDESDLGYSSLRNILTLYKSVFDYAMKNDLAKKDYSQYVKIKTENDNEKGVPFSESEIKKMWDNKNNDVIQIALIMIYSGMRISELETVKVDKKNRIMVGGVKTKNGKNRVIPIHKSIMPFIDKVNGFKATNGFRDLFYTTLAELGIRLSVENTKHTPHDCRHTFSWLADKYKMDKLSKHMIMGHSYGKDVEDNVYGHRTTQELIDAIDLIEV